MDKPAPTERPVLDVIRRRWSPRAFGPKPIPPDALKSLFEAARWAMSSYNEQPWRFILATRDNQSEHQRLLDCLLPANQTWAKAAPVLALNVAKLNFTRGEKPNRVAIYDAGAAAAFLTLQATALGLYVHQMAGIDQDKCRSAYKIPQGFEPVAALAIGYGGDPDSLPDDLAKAEKEPRSRKPFPEFVFTGSWESPAKVIA